MKKGNNTLGNIAWKFSERITAQVVTLLVSIILARLLDPEHYGLISIVMIFITIANVFVSDGFGSALIQKKDADELDFNSVLWFNLFFSFVLYLILFVFAPFISNFYGEGYELITPVLRVLGIRLIVSSINSVQHAYVAKKMIFKKFFLATLFGTLVSGVIGIYMAYSGFGVWALVGQYLANTTIDTIVLQFSLKIKPKMLFSFSRLKGLIGFGSRILATNLMIAGYEELRALIIGKIYTSSDLAFFDRAKQFPTVITYNISSSITSVLFPRMSIDQDNISEVKNIARRSIRFGSYIMCPLMLGMLGVARPFVSLVLTEKWLPCVPLMQLICINSLFMPFHTTNMQVIKALGRSDITFRVEAIKKLIELVVLICVMRISVFAIVIGMVACSTTFTLINAFPNIKLINYKLKEQISDVAPSLSMSILMCLIVLAIDLLNINDLYIFVIQIVVGVTIYLLLSLITKNPEFKFVISLIKSSLKKTNNSNN